MSDQAPSTATSPAPATPAPTSCAGCTALSLRLDVQSERIDKLGDALLQGGNLHLTGEYLVREVIGREHPENLRNLFDSAPKLAPATQSAQELLQSMDPAQRLEFLKLFAESLGLKAA